MKIKSSIVFLFLLLFISSKLNAQHKLDSLLQKSNNYKKDDTTKINLLNAVAREYQYIDPSEGLRISDSAILLAQRLHLENSDVFMIKAENYWRKSMDKEALECLQKALEINNAKGDDYRKAQCTNDEGNVYYEMGDYSTAMNDFHKALGIFENLKNEKRYCQKFKKYRECV